MTNSTDQLLANSTLLAPEPSCRDFLRLLGDFYLDVPERLAIDARFIAPEEVPQPQRDLLVHFDDMTSTLARYHGEPISLEVLESDKGPEWYRRHIVLRTAQSMRPVEYGAMQILLPQLSEAAQREVLGAKVPLGAVLARNGLTLRHSPAGFFKIQSNRLIEQCLGLSTPQWLFGRCNRMSDNIGRVVAEVVEILPP